MDERTYGVGELAGVIGRVVSQAFPATTWIRGQIRNLSRSANGHVYFDLAEPGPLGAPPTALIPITLLAGDKATVNAVMRQAGAAGRFEDGVEVRIAGRLAWYAPRGRLQMRMTGVDPAYTLGRLLEDRDRLLAQLKAEGVLGRNRGVPVPALPLRVALVTSLGSAAHADFVHELERSGVGFHLVEIDARTQGLDAGSTVAAAIALAGSSSVDVVALVRGGGSRTDLAPFDGAAIARAIATCPRPVFCGIGHEVDRSIADEVAHTSFKTPTACAAGLVDLVQAARQRAERVFDAITALAAGRLAQADDRVSENSWRVARSTRSSLAVADQNLTLAAARLGREARRALAAAEARLAGHEARARALDPAMILERGWSITRTGDGTIVRSADQLAAGDVLETRLAAGSVTSTVLASRPEAPLDD